MHTLKIQIPSGPSECVTWKKANERSLTCSGAPVERCCRSAGKIPVLWVIYFHFKILWYFNSINKNSKEKQKWYLYFLLKTLELVRKMGLSHLIKSRLLLFIKKLLSLSMSDFFCTSRNKLRRLYLYFMDVYVQALSAHWAPDSWYLKSCFASLTYVHSDHKAESKVFLSLSSYIQ